MADKNDEGPIKVHSDVPRGSELVVRDAKEARRTALAISGELPPNRGVYWCMTCGFREGGTTKYPKGLTLDFDDDELAALGGDPYQYGGPCPVCGFMTLTGMHLLAGDQVSLHERVKDQKRQDYREQAEIQAEVLTEKVAEIMTGGAMAAGGAATRETAASGPPGRRDDLPEEVDTSDLKPRGT